MARFVARRLLAAALLSLLALGLTPVLPAQAATVSGRTSSSDGVLWRGCIHHPWTYDIEVGDGVQSWSATVRLEAADGTLVDSDYLYGYADGTRGRGLFVVCGSEAPGVFRIEVDVTTYDSSYHSSTTSLPDGTFSMREARSKTRLRVLAGSRLRVISRVERPRGFGPALRSTVRLQTRVDGHWRRVVGTRTEAGPLGRHVYRLPVTRPTRVRAVTMPRNGVAESFSRAVLLVPPA